MQFYHSIHARGEDLEEVLRQAELDEHAASDGTKSKGSTKKAVDAESNPDALDEELEDGEVGDDLPEQGVSSGPHGIIGPQLPHVQI